MGSRPTLSLLAALMVAACSELEPTSPRMQWAVVEREVVRFATIGDFGEAGEAEEGVANLVKSWNPDHVLALGDNNYPDGEASTIDANIGQYYHSFIYPYTGSYGPGATSNRFWAVLGNHDYHADGAGAHFDYFTFPGNERYYDVRDGPVHFFALNSNRHEPDDRDSASIQASWLRNALGASTAPWKIVFFHHSPYSSSKHGDAKVMQWPFREWGADVVITSHDHVYERLLVDDLPYIVNGLGGNPDRYNWRGIHPGSLVRYNSDHGAQLVEATAERLSLKFYTRTGLLIDDYTLWKDGRRSTTVSFQNGMLPTTSYEGTIDTYISENDTIRNFGSATTLRMDGSDPGGLDKRAILKWDLSAIPSTATVTAASITLNVVDASTHRYSVYRIKRNWKEDRATWLHYTDGAPWDGPGANSTKDRSARVLGTITGTSVGSYTITLNSAGVALVQGWVNGTNVNRGVMIMDAFSSNGLDVSSSEAMTVANRPKLTVTYH